MEEEQRSNIFDSTFKLKDVVQFVGGLITIVWFVVTMNAKLEALTGAVNELKETDNKQYATQDISIKQLQNQVNTNQIQISLIQKDVDMIKSSKK